MSGDVQPRKRKDRKRKKDDYGDISAQSQSSGSSSAASDDVNIHVHKEDGTGGGICAKVVFFLLFTALAVLIGLIITEHRGLTDLDSVDSESKFSQIFEGWVDSGTGHDDEHDEHLLESLEEEHDDQDHVHEEDSHEVEEHEDEEEEDEDDDDDDHGDEDDDSHDQEGDDQEQDEEDQVSEERNQFDDEDEDQDDDDIDDEIDQDETNEEPTLESEEQDEEDDDNYEDNISDVKEDDDDGNDQEEETSQQQEDDDDEIDQSKNLLEEEDDDDGEEEQGDADDHVDNVASKEQDKSQEQDIEDEEEHKVPPKSAPVETKEVGKQEDARENEQDYSRMAIKIGVGVALLVVAHVVLVRKWKSGGPDPIPEKHEPTPDLSRRNTIVVPPSFQEVEQDIEETIESDYSDEDGEVDSEDELNIAKVKYQELRTTYERSLTPESELDYQTKPTEAEDEEEYDEEEGEDEEEVDDDEEEESENEPEDEDEDLLKRLEAKYGKIKKNAQTAGAKPDDFDEQLSSWKRVNVRPDNEAEESESDRQSDDPDTYGYENITNKDDWKIKDKLDEAQEALDNNAANAVALFDVLLDSHPNSPRCWFGKARAFDSLAEERKSNELLQRAINSYLQVLRLDDVPDALFVQAAERCINRMRFGGNYNRAIGVHNLLIDRFPDEAKYRNQLAVSYLTVNRVNKARQVLEGTLSRHPNDGFSLVHYGFILKTSDGNLEEAVKYLRDGFATKDEGVLDGRFFFHLGDALARLGKVDDAMKVYEEGVEHNLFLSKYQRSLYNVDRLEGKPWWSKDETPYKSFFDLLESNWKKIRDEGLSVLSKSGHFQEESENLRDTGDWQQFELFARGRKNAENCKKCPFTCELIEKLPDARNCKRGQTKFSVMHPGTHVWPHCGPTNCRLRVHLGLNVPPRTFIRVADEIRSWTNGKVLIFDDSFEHEVWHNGSSSRLILIVDVWHPELSRTEKNCLSPI